MIWFNGLSLANPIVGVFVFAVTSRFNIMTNLMRTNCVFQLLTWLPEIIMNNVSYSPRLSMWHKIYFCFLKCSKENIVWVQPYGACSKMFVFIFSKINGCHFFSVLLWSTIFTAAEVVRFKTPTASAEEWLLFFGARILLRILLTFLRLLFCFGSQYSQYSRRRAT